jgi:hypothetical protein
MKNRKEFKKYSQNYFESFIENLLYIYFCFLSEKIWITLKEWFLPSGPGYNLSESIAGG